MLSVLVAVYRIHTQALGQLGRMSCPKWKLVTVKWIGCSSTLEARDADMIGKRQKGWEKYKKKFELVCKQTRE